MFLGSSTARTRTRTRKLKYLVLSRDETTSLFQMKFFCLFVLRVNITINLTTMRQHIPLAANHATWPRNSIWNPAPKTTINSRLTVADRLPGTVLESLDSVHFFTFGSFSWPVFALISCPAFYKEPRLDMDNHRWSAPNFNLEAHGYIVKAAQFCKLFPVRRCRLRDFDKLHTSTHKNEAVA